MTNQTENPQVKLENLGYKQELERSLSMPALVTYGLIFMVPIAPMSIFGVVFNLSHGMIALTYIIGFIAMFFTAISYRYMTEEVPTAGSVYAYVGAGLGKTVGFLAGWAIVLDYLLFPTLAAVFGGIALHSVLPQVPQLLWVFAYILFSTTANYLGVKWADNIDKILLVCQIIVLILFVWFAIAALSHGINGAEITIKPFYDSSQFSISFVFTAISIAALNFLGFDAISTLSEEAKGGGRATGRAIIISLLIVVVCFVLLTTLAAWMVPHVSHFASGKAENEAFFDIAEMIGGAPLKIACAMSVSILAAIGNILTAQAAVSRVLYSMARDGVMPKFLAQINPKHKVPSNAILFIGVITAVLGTIFVGDVSMISSLVNVGALTGFALLNLAVIVLFLAKKKEKSYFSKGLCPLLGVLILMYVIFHMERNAQIIGIIWFVIGLIFLFLRKKSGKNIQLENFNPDA